MTIVEAVKTVLEQAGQPLTINDIYEAIFKANLYSFKTKKPHHVVTTSVRRHCQGLDFPAASPIKYFVMVAEGKYALISNAISDTRGNWQLPLKADAQNKEERIPEEIIEDAYQAHIASLEQQLIETILNAPPVFFETLVIKLLLQMGYGKQGASKHTGKSNDGGIDGVIFQDSLGLDRIYIQAKRYASHNTVGRPEIQQFVGALEHITKGVFITTGSFTRSATDYARNQQQKNLVLIDGEKLTNLMIKYKVGLQEIKTYTTYKIDSDFFSLNE